MDNKKQVKVNTIMFFKGLIEKTNTYYLSDYVEEYSEFDDKIISKDEHIKIVKERDLLRTQCEEVGLDIHKISCDVASVFVETLK